MKKSGMRSMQAHLLSREVLLLYLSLRALAAAALLCDAALHLLDAVWIGRWIGIPGTLLIRGRWPIRCASAS